MSRSLHGGETSQHGDLDLRLQNKSRSLCPSLRLSHLTTHVWRYTFWQKKHAERLVRFWCTVFSLGSHRSSQSSSTRKSWLFGTLWLPVAQKAHKRERKWNPIWNWWFRFSGVPYWLCPWGHLWKSRALKKTEKPMWLKFWPHADLKQRGVIWLSWVLCGQLFPCIPAAFLQSHAKGRYAFRPQNQNCTSR